ncbi:hypothetical protein [Halalkalicoccus subterraneus]|uniref:hypothetical protein n=1 Tax=Halalkalicoccus subterraneus TaxID=2675002 RepID=UPI001FE720DD|nr:hypothetical protein [Halalkalicoccus subterraneus]
MSDPLRVEAEGVTVTKRYEPERFAVPTIGFEIRSTRETPVEVRLEEGVPDSFSPAAIGLHPDYDDEQWTITEERLVFESRIDPGTTVVTVYGIRISDDADATAFMNRPEVTVDPVEPDDRPMLDASDIDGGFLEELVSELSALRRDIATIDARVEATINRQDEAIGALESNLERPDRKPDGTADLAADIEAVSDDLDALYDEVGEIQAWRERVGVSIGTE